MSTMKSRSFSWMLLNSWASLDTTSITQTNVFLVLTLTIIHSNIFLPHPIISHITTNHTNIILPHPTNSHITITYTIPTLISHLTTHLITHLIILHPTITPSHLLIIPLPTSHLEFWINQNLTTKTILFSCLNLATF